MLEAFDRVAFTRFDVVSRPNFSVCTLAKEGIQNKWKVCRVESAQSSARKNNPSAYDYMVRFS